MKTKTFTEFDVFFMIVTAIGFIVLFLDLLVWRA
jgi:hypothetical protein